MPAGQPTKYKEEYNELAYKFCLLGATDEFLAKAFNICVATLNNWKQDYPKFLASIKEGKEIADAEIANALFHRAKGYSHPDIDIKMYEGQIIETPLVKHYPPDTGAIAFWLKNRQPDTWRDKKEIDATVKTEQIPDWLKDKPNDSQV